MKLSRLQLFGGRVLCPGSALKLSSPPVSTCQHRVGRTLRFLFGALHTVRCEQKHIEMLLTGVRDAAGDFDGRRYREECKTLSHLQVLSTWRESGGVCLQTPALGYAWLSVMSVLCKHEDSCLDFWYPCKSWCTATQVCNPSSGKEPIQAGPRSSFNE